MAVNKNQKRTVFNVCMDGEFEKLNEFQNNVQENLKPWQRLNLHHTYSSVRRNVNFKPFQIMADHLDLVLKTTYQHGQELFPDAIDISFQPVTLGLGSKIKSNVASGKKHHFSGFGNYGFSRHYEPKTFAKMKKFVLSKQLFPDHPLIISGIKERVHPSYVKLMNSSHHSPQTNAGYVRQDRDGNIFYY